MRVKSAFGRLGRLSRPKQGFSGFIDRSLDGAIRAFQRDNGSREDGFMRPRGPTHRTLLAQARRIAERDAERDRRHRIDFGFISNEEGGRRLDGYVPPDHKGQPSPKSGVTIGTGLDLGQRSRADLDRLGLPAGIKSKLEPVLGAKGSAAQRLLGRQPLQVTAEEAELIDRQVRRGITNQVIRTYNRNSRFRFEELPSALQTVIASVGFQNGPSFASTPDFFGFATRGDVPGMIAELREFRDEHSGRRNREADFLETNLPRPKLKPRI